MCDFVGEDPRELSDGELAEALVRVHTRLAALEAAAARLTAEADARDLHGGDGAATMAAWLAWRTRLPAADCARRLRLGRALRTMPATAAAWTAGAIGAAHVHVLARARTERTAAAFAPDEATLVDYASTLSFRSFVAAVAYWTHHVDPDGAESVADRQRATRRLHLSRSLGGQWYGDMALDPVNGAIVDTELRRRYHQLLAQDHKDAAATLGRPALPHELGRTPAQRLADALVEMAIRSAATPARHRRPAPLFSVILGGDALARLCQLADGTVLTPGALHPWLHDAHIEAAVFAGPPRHTRISHQRTFTGALRRIIELRDRTCYHPSCEQPAPRCQIDHITPFDHGGPTTETNGRLACPHHNRHRNRPPPDDP